MSTPALPRPVRRVATADGWEAAWTAALSALELEVERAEALLAAGTVPAAEPMAVVSWVAPQLQGPLPETLRARAEAIVARQQRAAEHLCRAIAAARQELTLVERLAWGGPDRGAPAFLDAQF